MRVAWAQAVVVAGLEGTSGSVFLGAGDDPIDTTDGSDPEDDTGETGATAAVEADETSGDAEDDGEPSCAQMPGLSCADAGAPTSKATL